MIKSIYSSNAVKTITMIVIVLSVPLCLNILLKGTYFTEHDKQLFIKQKPQDVFLGNSVLATRINPELLKRLMPERKIVFLTLSGSLPNVWYRIIRNNILASGSRPERIFFFLADDTSVFQISLPNSSYQIGMVLRTSSVDYDPILIEEIVLSHPIDTIKYLLMLAYPIQSLNEKVDWLLKQFVLLFAYSPFREAFLSHGQIDYLTVRSNHLERINARLKQRVANDSESNEPLPLPHMPQEVQNTDFNVLLQQSYLPKILDLLRSHDIVPIFIQVKVLTNKDQQGQSNHSSRIFRKNLAHYLAGQGVVYIDESEDPAITRKMFSDAIHLHENFMGDYTKNFVQKYNDLIQSGQLEKRSK